MKEISLHILDILQNSITAGAKLVELCINENTEDDIFMFYIKDDGCGMSAEFLKNVINPFTTKRTTRKVGLGIPLLKLAAENAGGGIKITSEPGVGTYIEATFVHSHIDRQPLGNITDTVFTVVTSYENVEFLFTHKFNNNEFVLDTRQIKEILGDVPLSDSGVMAWLLEYLKEGEAELYSSK